MAVDHKEQTEQQPRDDELHPEQGELPAVAVLLVATEGDGNGHLVVEPSRHQSSHQEDKEADGYQYPTAPVEHQRTDWSGEEILYRSLAEEHEDGSQQHRQTYMHHCLGEDDGMDILRFGTIALAHRHLTGTGHEVAHDDEQIVHHGGKEQHKGDDAHNPPHHPDVGIIRIHLAEYGKAVVQRGSRLLQFFQREMVLHQLFNVWLELACLVPLCQADIGTIAIVSYPLVATIVT